LFKVKEKGGFVSQGSQLGNNHQDVRTKTSLQDLPAHHAPP